MDGKSKKAYSDSGYGESTPLLVQRQDTFSDENAASNLQTALNLVKTCMGSGCLALPFACQQGGIVLFTIGLAGAAAWNIYSVQRLVNCLAYLPNPASVPSPAPTDSEDGAKDSTILSPPEGISLLGKVAWHSFGPIGVEVLDIMMMILLLGVIVAYFCAVLSFVGGTPFSFGKIGDGVVVAIILTCISLVPHVGVLSHASALGLTVLFGTFVVIFGYGFIENNQTPSLSLDKLDTWPSSMKGISHSFGVVVFGYGIVPMTYNFQASMREPHRIVHVASYAIFATAMAYLVMGIGLYALFPALEGDVLSELPKVGFLPVATRLAMVVVVLMTAPLIVVPCSELLEGKWQHKEIWKVRLAICAISCLIAVAFPDFVSALSVVGSTCVAAVSFGIPPLLHWRLCFLHQHKVTFGILVDGIMFLLGVIMTVVATLYNLNLL